jgi:hypothetical protein
LRAYTSAQIFRGASIPPWKYVIHVALVSYICMNYSCPLEEGCDKLMEDDVEIDYRFGFDASIVEYGDRVGGFSQIEGVVDECS